MPHIKIIKLKRKELGIAQKVTPSSLLLTDN
jgi:hypothetical protein